MHNSRAKYRKIKYIFSKSLNTIKFKIEAFSFSKIIILVWVIIWYLSLFMTHINWLYSNIFNRITFISSIIIILLLTIVVFLLFSYNKKEKIKKSANIIFRDYIIILFISILLFVISINNLWVITGLETFDSSLSYWSWVIMIIISSIFIFIWGFLLKNEYYLTKNIYLNDSKEQKSQDIEKNNTKLPF